LRSGVRQLFEGIRQDQKRIALASSAKEGELKTYKIIADIDDLTKAETSSDLSANGRTTLLPCSSL